MSLHHLLYACTKSVVAISLLSGFIVKDPDSIYKRYVDTINVRIGVISRVLSERNPPDERNLRETLDSLTKMADALRQIGSSKIIYYPSYRVMPDTTHG